VHPIPGSWVGVALKSKFESIESDLANCPTPTLPGRVDHGGIAGARARAIGDAGCRRQRFEFAAQRAIEIRREAGIAIAIEARS
jgi:hypothetical protein